MSVVRRRIGEVAKRGGLTWRHVSVCAIPMRLTIGPFPMESGTDAAIKNDGDIPCTVTAIQTLRSNRPPTPAPPRPDSAAPQGPALSLNSGWYSLIDDGTSCT